MKVRDQRSKTELLDLYRCMRLIRLFEEKAGQMYQRGKIRGFMHLYIGEEAIAAGAVAALSKQDYIVTHYRDHGHALARGIEPKYAMAELFGKATGCSAGKGGSMHIANFGLGILGANGIVGAGLPLATGAALAAKIRGGGEGALCFFGDGASNEGSVHEAANMAALYKLPCVFVCENNGYGEYTPQANHQAIVDGADRAAGYGMPGVVIDGMDGMAVYEAAGEAIERARIGGGPTLV